MTRSLGTSILIGLALAASAAAEPMDPRKLNAPLAADDPVVERAGICPVDDYDAYDSGFLGVAIPDNDPGGVFIGSVSTTATGTPFADIICDVDISHTWVGDLRLYLYYDENNDSIFDIGPIALLCRPQIPSCDPTDCCGCEGDLAGVYRFSDGAAEALGETTCTAVLAPGCYTTEPIFGTTLSQFDGFASGGTFWLFASDNAFGDAGSVTSFTMYSGCDAVRTYPTEYPTVQAAVDAACDGNTIELLDDAPGEFVVATDKVITFDGNNHTVGSLTFSGGSGAIDKLIILGELNAAVTDPSGGGLSLDFHVKSSTVFANTSISSAFDVEVILNASIFTGSVSIGLDDDRGTVEVSDNSLSSGLSATSLRLDITGNDAGGEFNLITFGFFSTIGNNTLTATGPGQTGIRLSGDAPGAVVHSVENNTITGYAKGIFFPLSGPDFAARDNVISDCTTGIEIEGAFAERNVIFNCGEGIVVFFDGDVTSNTVTDCTTALALNGGSGVLVANNILVNSATGVSGSSTPTFLCNDVWNNSVGYLGFPDLTGTDGNFRANPLFCDAAGEDFRIEESSPCADGNHPAGVPCGLIGALDPCPIIDVASDQTTPTARRLVTARPNPSRGAITFDVAEGGAIGSFRIYDTAGRLVRALELPAGDSARSVTWDGRGDAGLRVAPGVYYYRVDGFAVPITQRVVVIQ